jgi:hypothetical protein
VTAEQYARYATRAHWITPETTYAEEHSFMWGDDDDNCDDSLTSEECGDDSCCHTPHLHRYAVLEVAAHDSHRDGIANRYITTLETPELALGLYGRVASSLDNWFAPVAIIDLDTNMPLPVAYNEATSQLEIVAMAGFVRPEDIARRWTLDAKAWDTWNSDTATPADNTPTLAFTLV